MKHLLTKLPAADGWTGWARLIFMCTRYSFKNSSGDQSVTSALSTRRQVSLRHKFHLLPLRHRLSPQLSTLTTSILQRQHRLSRLDKTFLLLKQFQHPSFSHITKPTTRDGPLWVFHLVLDEYHPTCAVNSEIVYELCCLNCRFITAGAALFLQDVVVSSAADEASPPQFKMPTVPAARKLRKKSMETDVGHDNR